MLAFGLQVTEEEVAKMIADTDKDNSGEVDFEEFVGMMTAKLATESSDEDLRKVWKQTFDPTGKGKIGIADLKRVCDLIGETISDANLMDMIKIADKNKDNAVDVEEFIRLIQGKGQDDDDE